MELPWPEYGHACRVVLQIAGQWLVQFVHAHTGRGPYFVRGSKIYLSLTQFCPSGSFGHYSWRWGSSVILSLGITSKVHNKYNISHETVRGGQTGFCQLQ